ncbi:MAG: TolC family protein [Hydrogenothermaceae bacterium]|nr:TolC family protein [Hydrogenothermaceae bacterium]
MKKFLYAILLISSISKAETFEEILQKAYESDIIKGKEYEVKSFEGEIIKAKAFANPEIYTEFGRVINKSNSSATLTELYLTQPLYLYGLRRYKTQEAINIYNSAKYGFDLFKREFIADIYYQFYEALYQKELLDIAAKELTFSEEIYNFVKKTYQLGEISKVDFLRSEKDYNLAKINFEKQQLLYKQSLEKLSATIGYLVKDVSGDFQKIEHIKQITISELPQIKIYRENISALENQENYYRSLAKPQFSVGFITREPFKNNYEAGFFLSVQLPIFYRYSGEIISARNKKAYFENLSKYTSDSLKIKVDSLTKTDQILRQQLKDIEENIIPTLNQQLQLANKSYKLKVIKLFELTNIKNDYFQTIRYRAEILNQLHKNFSEYLRIGGNL